MCIITVVSSLHYRYVIKQQCSLVKRGFEIRAKRADVTFATPDDTYNTYHDKFSLSELRSTVHVRQ